MLESNTGLEIEDLGSVLLDRLGDGVLSTLILRLARLDDAALAPLSKRMAFSVRDEHELLTVREAADRAKVSPDTIRRGIRRGDLPATKAGGPVRLLRSDLDRWTSPIRNKRGTPVSTSVKQPLGRKDLDHNTMREALAEVGGAR